MIRRQLFHQPNGASPMPTTREEIIEPIRGLNTAHPLQTLRPGETPFSQNWVIGDSFIEPRSGLSRFGSAASAAVYLANDVPLYAAYASERVGTDVAYIVSKGTIIQHAPGDSTSSWTIVHGTKPASNRTKAVGTFYDGFYDHAVVFDPTSGTQYLLLTNWSDMPLKVPVQSSGNAAASIISSFVSDESFARFVEIFDDRSVFFSTRTAGNVNQTRVRWSARGLPFDFTNGGFQDLVDMQGIPTGMVAAQDKLVFTTTREVWVARARRDAYAFDFFSLDRGVGNLFPLSLLNTAAGPIWLGANNQFHRLDGNEIRFVGTELRNFLKEEIREPQTAFAQYDSTTATYAFHYSDTTGEYPTKALFLRVDTLQPSAYSAGIDDGSWLMQDFGTRQIAAGARVNPDLAPENVQDVFLVSSKDSPYRLLSSQTNDDGTLIDARWRSHVMRGAQNGWLQESIKEAWVDVALSTSSASITLHATENLGASFRTIGTLSFSSTTATAFLPVDPIASRYPQIELRVNDGSKPKVGRMHFLLGSYTGRFRGA